MEVNEINLVILFGVWLVLSLIVGLYARYKGRSFVLYFVLSCAVTPILTGFMLYRMKEKRSVAWALNEKATPKLNYEERICKKCGVVLKPGYSICHVCHCINLIKE